MDVLHVSGHFYTDETDFDCLFLLCGPYLRDVDEEEKTLMRKRASAPGW